MNRQVAWCSGAALVALLIFRVAAGALAITHPSSGQIVQIGSSFNVAGTGANLGMPPNMVRVRGWRSPGLIGVEEPNFSFATFPGAGGTFETSGITYTGGPGTNGIIVADQSGNPPDAHVTVEWKLPPG
jgi:hypothetical protein